MVMQLNYIDWPDKKVPESATSLLDFRKKVTSLNPKGEGPLLVHCRYR